MNDTCLIPYQRTSKTNWWLKKGPLLNGNSQRNVRIEHLLKCSQIPHLQNANCKLNHRAIIVSQFPLITTSKRRQKLLSHAVFATFARWARSVGNGGWGSNITLLILLKWKGWEPLELSQYEENWAICFMLVHLLSPFTHTLAPYFVLSHALHCAHCLLVHSLAPERMGKRSTCLCNKCVDSKQF